MTTSEAMQLVGVTTPADLARKLNITPAAVYQWEGQVPELRQYKIRELIAEAEQKAAA